MTRDESVDIVLPKPDDTAPESGKDAYMGQNSRVNPGVDRRRSDPQLLRHLSNIEERLFLFHCVPFLDCACFGAFQSNQHNQVFNKERVGKGGESKVFGS